MDRNNGSVDVAPDPIVPTARALVDSPVLRLWGYVGDSLRSGYIRLYADLSFQSYYEIQTSDVLERVRLGDRDGASGSLLTVKFDAILQAMESGPVGADWLAGTVTAENLRGAGHGPRALGQPPTTKTKSR